jgi:hypothetical protein
MFKSIKNAFFLIALSCLINYTCLKTYADVNKEVKKMDQEMEWEILKALKGEFYTKKREKIISSTPDLRKQLEIHLQSDSREDVIQARIILGWDDYKDVYLQLFTEFDSIDPDLEKKKVAGMNRIWDGYALKAKNEYKKSILPLCWEMLLKNVNIIEKWKIITFIYMTCAVPDELSLHVLQQFIETTHDPDYYDIIFFELERSSWTGLNEWYTNLKNKHNVLLEKIEQQLMKQSPQR